MSNLSSVNRVLIMSNLSAVNPVRCQTCLQSILLDVKPCLMSNLSAVNRVLCQACLQSNQTPSTGLRHPSLQEGAGKRCSECDVKPVCRHPCLMSNQSVVNPVFCETSLQSALSYAKPFHVLCQTSLQSTLSYVKPVCNQLCLKSNLHYVKPVCSQPRLMSDQSAVNLVLCQTSPSLTSNHSAVNPALYETNCRQASLMSRSKHTKVVVF